MSGETRTWISASTSGFEQVLMGLVRSRRRFFVVHNLHVRYYEEPEVIAFPS